MEKRYLKLDSFALKVIAIIGMSANHLGNAFYNYLPLTIRAILIGFGGLTFPIMAYQISVGYQHTRDVRKYALRLGAFALVSLVPFIWVLGPSLNIMFTLLLGLLIIWADDTLQGSDSKRLVFYLLLTAAVLVTHWCDWSYIGVPMILLYHRGRGQSWQPVLPVAMVWLMGLGTVVDLLARSAPLVYWHYNLPMLLYCFVGATATIPLIRAYNDEQGRPMKYFFYLYYPLHIAILGVAKGLIFGVWW
ncbi:MAG: conjugal transfer protein TraX [Coriobacteriia bacterium]|nr:conjugal transfer protein TraX [Coriobacteriia bacterium]